MSYLYSMSSGLVNVRLDDDRLRKARALRARGMTLSSLLREAIDDRFAQMNARRTRADVVAVMQDIFEQSPDPSHLPPRTYNVHDRKEARDAILRKLRRRQR